MTNPNLPPSDEVWIEGVLDEASEEQFRANAANLRAINRNIAETHDPDQIVELMDLKAEVFPRTLGSLALWGVKEAKLKEIEDLESQPDNQ